jgi:DNA-binding IclR family transcriptional regulator
MQISVEETDEVSFCAESSDRQFVTALARGLELLRCFRDGQRHLGNGDLARRSGIPKPTVSRLTHTLTTLGYLDYSEETGKYALGAGVLALGYSLLSSIDVRQLARAPMQALADEARGTVAIGTRDRLSMVFVETCRSDAPVALSLDVGSRIPLPSTAMGRAYLCALSAGERAGLLDRIQERDPLHWPRLDAGIAQALQCYEDKGYCLSIGEWERDVNSVAVPLRGPLGGPTLVINCGGPAFRMSREVLENDIAPRLTALAHQLEGSLGLAKPEKAKENT